MATTVMQIGDWWMVRGVCTQTGAARMVRVRARDVDGAIGEASRLGVAAETGGARLVERAAAEGGAGGAGGGERERAALLAWAIGAALARVAAAVLLCAVLGPALILAGFTSRREAPLDDWHVVLWLLGAVLIMGGVVCLALLALRPAPTITCGRAAAAAPGVAAA